MTRNQGQPPLATPRAKLVQHEGPAQPETMKTLFKTSSKGENSLAVLRLGLCGLPGEGEGSIPGRELRPYWLGGCDP